MNGIFGTMAMHCNGLKRRCSALSVATRGGWLGAVLPQLKGVCHEPEYRGGRMQMRADLQRA